MSQVSGECVEWGELRVLSNGLRALERLKNLAPDGASGLPFYRPRERPGVHTRERKREKKEKKKEKKSREEESPGATSLFFSDRWVPLAL
jgi:hypothetical protein